MYRWTIFFCLSFVLALSFVVGLCGCGDDTTTPPPLTDSGMGIEDSGGGEDSSVPPTDSGGGTDAGTGEDGGGMLGAHSRITIRLESGPMTFPAVDTAGNGVVLTSGEAVDALGTGSESIALVAGSTWYELNLETLELDNPIEMVDAAGDPTAPDFLLTADLGGGPVLAGVFGNEIRIWDFDMARWGDAATLLEITDPTGPTTEPFDPEWIGVVDFSGTGNLGILALSPDTPNLFLADAMVRFTEVPMPPQTCDAPIMTVDGDILVGASVPGVSPVGASGDSAILISGSDAYALLLGGGRCFGERFTLDDQAGTPIDPIFAFGADFDGDDADDLVLVHE